MTLRRPSLALALCIALSSCSDDDAPSGEPNPPDLDVIEWLDGSDW